VKRLTLFAATLGALLSAACGGGSGSNGNPPPPVGKFTLASLKGNFAFSMTGEDLNNGGFITRAGSFVADGNGNITSAIEDLDDNGVINNGTNSPVVLSGGTYTMEANGKGTITFPNAAGNFTLSFTMSNASPAGQGFLIETDLLIATASGTFEQQNLSSFSQPFAAATYIFDVSGVDGVGAPTSFVGGVATNGTGGVGVGVFDRNDGNISTDPSGPVAIPTGAAYQLDPTNSANFGRGTITLTGVGSFAFYPIDQTHLKLLEVDGTGFTSGDIFQQTGAIATQKSAFTGSFVYSVGGSASVQGFGFINSLTRAGRFTADGSGGLTSIVVDQNNEGLATCVAPTNCNSTSASGTYTIDTTNGNGRGTLDITFPGQQAGFANVFYQISPTAAVIQDVDSNVVADGTMFGQSGSFTNASLAGNYVFNFSGQVLPSGGNVGFEEDFVGQYALSGASSNNIFGVTDFIEPGSTSNRVPAFLNVPITGTLNISGDGTGRNGYQIVTGNSPGTNINFAAYFISPNQVLLIGTQNTRVTVGTVSSQQVP
jgi:hypothetical protein